MSYPEILIQASQIEAKLINEELRKQAAYKTLCFHDDLQDEYIAAAVRQRYETTYKEVLPFLATVPLTRSMVRQLAKLFQTDPVIELTGVDEGTALADEFSMLLDKARLFSVLKQIDRLCETCHQVGVLPHYDEKKDRVYLQIITPDKLTVWQNKKIPTQIDALAYPIVNTENTMSYERADRYAYWTDTEYREGMLMKNGVFEADASLTMPNPYGKIPVIFFSIETPIDRFWLDAGYPIITANENADMQLTAFNMGVDFQSFATMVTEGFPENKSITRGVSRFINIARSLTDGTAMGRAYYINPGVNLKQIWDIINENISLVASMLGVSADFVKGGSNYTSGYQLRLSMTGIVDHNQDKRSIYIEPLRELVQIMMDCKRIYGMVNLPQDADIMIDYADVQVTPNQMEQEQIRTIKLANGTMSVIDAIMEDNQDLTREQAIERKQQIDLESATYTKAPNLEAGMFE